MLDHFAVFTRGGALLWALQFTSLRHSPVEAVNALIKNCLLEERSSDTTFTYTPKAGAAQSLKWTFHNGLGLVFVAAYQKALSLLYVDELLAAVKAEFVGSHYKLGKHSYPDFGVSFQRMLRDAESRAEAAKRPAVMRSGPPLAVKALQSNGVLKGGGIQALGSSKTGAADDEEGGGGNANGSSAAPKGSSSDDDTAMNGDGESDPAGKAFDVSRLPKGMASRGGRGGRGGRVSGGAPAPTKSDVKDVKKVEAGPRKKVARNWGLLKTSNGGSSAASTANLDYSVDFEGDAPTGPSDVSGTSGDESGRDTSAGGDGGPGRGGTVMRGPSQMEVEEDISVSPLEKNVAEGIAAQVVASVGRSLEGQKLSSFTGVGAFVRQAFEDALSGILNKRTVDVLMDIKKAQARGKPYVIVFCGVNGVGKSTNLAKIAYWLTGHGVKVMIAACDTFRAGAVEQLKTHCARLKVPLYERGYEKDPAKVAYEGARQAERDGCHVLLVDTAGRMQDNEPLMRALSNLINVNEPNLVLFVGEALVGNDAVDQLRSAKASMIDGIVLTKFDTIDDKVGAALSMVYSSGAPIMFVGCGQTYVDLKKLNVKSVVRSLLK
ncbi:MAG: hypothetical protein WDW38_008903 [Sanguina aurantia]